MDINIENYKKFVKELDDEILYNLGDDYTSCWMFAYYVHTIYDLPLLNNEPFYEEKNEKKINLDKNGIYSYFMSHNTEFHHFILFVNNNNVNLMATYGGQKNIVKIDYNKNDLINMFDNLLNDNNNKSKIKKYCELFGIKKVCFKILDMENFHLSYTFREH